MIQIKTSKNLVHYKVAQDFMQEIVEKIISGKHKELIWFLEHEDVYTAGTSANNSELLEQRFEVFDTGRGGKYTYHGPGQRVIYIMLDLQKREKDIRKYVYNLEEVIIRTLRDIGVNCFRYEDNIGIWTKDGGKLEKIAAIGIRAKKWVTFHGIAINISTDLSKFNGIIPCGISSLGVTSLDKIGYQISLNQFDKLFLENFHEVFS